MTFAEDFGLAKLPPRMDIVLYLIESEFRNKKLLNRVEELGPEEDTSVYAADLSSLILSLSGFGERSDAVYDWYHQTLEQAVEDIPNEAWSEKLSEHSFRFYIELEMVRQGMKDIAASPYCGPVENSPCKKQNEERSTE